MKESRGTHVMKRRLLILLLSFTMVLSLMPALAFAGNETDEEITLNTQEKVVDDDTRIYGSTRYDTAMEVAKIYKTRERRTFKNAIVAYGKNFPDALAGGYLAKVKEAPILLVDPSAEDKVADFINQYLETGGTVYLLGGTGVVSPSFENKVKSKGIKTERIGGKDRYDTNLKILQAAGVTNEDILVCTGTGYADSLSASAAGLPILLVGNSLNDAQKTYLKSLGTSKFYLIGGTGAVNPAIENGLKSLGYTDIERLAGKSRYETSTAVANKFYPRAHIVVFAYAKNFPDGLAGGPLAIQKQAPIILTDSNNTAAAKEYVKTARAKMSITLGGPALISDEAVQTIMDRHDPTIEDLYYLVDDRGYVNDDGDKTLEFLTYEEVFETDYDFDVYFVDHSDSVEFRCVQQDEATNAYTTMTIPLNPASTYKTEITIGTETLTANVDAPAYTRETALVFTRSDGSKPSENEEENDQIQNLYNSVFRNAMKVWDYAVGYHGQLDMSSFGFTSY